MSHAKTKPKRSPKRKVALAPSNGWAATLRKLESGEEIRIGDWCCAAGMQPVRVIVEQGLKVTKYHWPHYRIEIQKQPNYDYPTAGSYIEKSNP